MTEILLIRHGETDWNVQGRFQGHTDTPLNDRGLTQARALAQTLAGQMLDAVYTSDLLRARQTAEILARQVGVTPTIDPRWREIHQGVWEGMVMEDIRRAYPEEFARRANEPLASAAPGGESVRQVRERVLEAVGEITQRHPAGRVAIVSHGLALALVRVHLLGLAESALWESIPPHAQAERIQVAPSRPA